MGMGEELTERERRGEGGGVREREREGGRGEELRGGGREGLVD